MLSRSYDPMIQADTQMEGQPPKTVISINVEIKRRQGFQSQSQTANSVLKELEFEFPVTEFSQVEAISQELGLSPSMSGD